MLHDTPLISILVAGLGLAFVFGMIATRLKVSPLVGYLVAGVVVGPFTPGYVADGKLAAELAELGVILLMFGVGLHFSMKDLVSVGKIAVPGAIVQITAATLLGAGLAYLLGWGWEAGLVFGLALSVASTVVLLRALQERRIVQTERGRIAVGWLIVEDIVMVLALVLLPVWADIRNDIEAAGGFDPAQFGAVAGVVALTLGKIVAFVAFMLIVGRRVIPWTLHRVVHTGSREMFRLAVLAIALGVAFGAASLFGVSFALGAFFAGMIMAESELSQQAANETLPLRDAFAVLFFVSVGMLFDPRVLIEDPWPLLATLAIIVVGKGLAALAIMQAFRQPFRSSLLIAVSLAQIGEFSFILAGLGAQLGLIPETASDLILGGAILSIILNPFLFIIADRLQKSAEAEATVAPEQRRAVLVGYGRTGSLVGAALGKAGAGFTVIEDSQQIVDVLKAADIPVVAGNAASAEVLRKAGIADARWLFVTVPDGFEAGSIVEVARAANPDLRILARAHSDAEVDHLKRFGANEIIMGEREIAKAMIVAAGALVGPSTPAPAAPPRPKASKGKALILDDAERSILEAIGETGVGPLEAFSLEGPLAVAAQRHGHDASRLGQAIGDLQTKGLIVDFGDGRMKLTKEGFLKLHR